MTCKDCIHYEVCVARHVLGKDWLIGKKNNENTEEDDCDKFKDKSKMIELPVKIGDTVFYIGNYVILGEVINYFKIGKTSISSLEYLGEGEWVIYDNRGNDFKEKEIFFTREEAEKTLKERENNG